MDAVLIYGYGVGSDHPLAGDLGRRVLADLGPGTRQDFRLGECDRIGFVRVCWWDAELGHQWGEWHVEAT